MQFANLFTPYADGVADTLGPTVELDRERDNCGLTDEQADEWDVVIAGSPKRHTVAVPLEQVKLYAEELARRHYVKCLNVEMNDRGREFVVKVGLDGHDQYIFLRDEMRDRPFDVVLKPELTAAMEEAVANLRAMISPSTIDPADSYQRPPQVMIQDQY